MGTKSNVKAVSLKDRRPATRVMNYSELMIGNESDNCAFECFEEN